MLTSPEAAAAAPWPGARKSCLLELPLGDLEPLGFIGWELQLSPPLARLTSAWISDDLGGRLLFHAEPHHLYDGEVELQPRRTVPLLLWLTHRSLRALYLCTPSEVMPLGDLLSELGPGAVSCDTVEECSPAALFDLLWRWIEEDPALPTLPAPEAMEERERGAEHPLAMPWRTPWTAAQLAAPSQRAPRRPLPPNRLVLPTVEAPAQMMTYGPEATLLVPLRLALENAKLRPQDLLEIVSVDSELRDPLVAGGHGGLACQAHHRAMTVLAPLQAPTWRARLRAFRDRLAARTGGEVSCTLASRAPTASLCRLTRGRLQRLSGADEVYRPPFPGASAAADPARTPELRRRLLSAIGFPLGEEVLAELPSARVLH